MSGDAETRQSRLDDGQELLSLGLVLLQVLRDSLRGLQPHLVQLVCLDNIFQNVVLLVAEALHIVHAEIDLLVDDATLGLVVLALEAVRLDALEAAERLLLLPILQFQRKSVSYQCSASPTWQRSSGIHDQCTF